MDADIIVARDGVEALDWLFALGEHVERDARQLPALILLDHRLPRLMRADVVHGIRSFHTGQRPLIPAVLRVGRR